MMRSDYNQILTKRVFVSCIIIVILFLIIIARLFFLQVINQKTYKLLSDKNRIYTYFSLAPRGTIFDRNGHILANSKFSFQTVIDLNRYKNSQKSWKKICENLKLKDYEEFEDLIRKNKKLVTRMRTIAIKENLNWDDILLSEVISCSIPGVFTEKKVTRFYENSNNFCHVIGYVTNPTVSDIEKDSSLSISGASIGKAGIESFFDIAIRGKIGMKNFEIDASRRVIRVIEELVPEKGKDIHLTIDAELQKEVTKIMSIVRNGAAVVLSVKTGEILAMVSVPNFDSNIFTSNLSKEEWKNISTNVDTPLINRAIAGLYAPGSTFKMMVAFAALQQSDFNKNLQIYCPGYCWVNGHKFHCWKWKSGGHGYMNLSQALEQSCDVYFFRVAGKIGAQPIIQIAKDFGIGSLTGVELIGEKKGVLPSSFMVGNSAGDGLTINLSIGQGKILTTPLQLAAMIASIASGKRLTPYLVKKSEKNLSFIKENFDTELPCSDEDLKTVRKALKMVVYGELGTARNIQNPEITIAGKTGTSQVCRITAEERQKFTQNVRPYHLRDHALFVGYAPEEDPKFAVSVIVEHGGPGGSVAAPLARDILIAANKLLK